jgi:uncharacterized membrane protein YfcA
MTWQFALTGLLVGILVGLTGMGGGSLMTPILVFGLGFSPTMAIGTDIAHGAIFKSVGAVRQRTLGNVKARLSGWMFLGSAPMSLAGVAVATLLERRYGDSVESTGAKVLGAALLLGGLGLLAKTLFVGDTVRVDSLRLTNRDRLVAFAIGFFGGFIVGLTSVGSGVFFGLTMLLAFPLKSAKIVGTDIFHAAALLWVAGLGHFVAGNVDLSAVGWLLLGSIPGVLIGSQFTIKVPDRALRGILAAVLVLSGLKLVDVPGSTVIVVVALCGGLAAGIAILAVQLVRRRKADRLAVPDPAPPGLRLGTGED